MKNFFLGLIISCAFILRLIPLNFPSLTADEARIAYRGYSLETFGSDELGRKYPLIFNSLEDYKLPLTSYITAGGIWLFGKSDLGFRLPFILIGTMIVWLTYLAASVFNPDQKFKLMAVLITAFSPALIFLSKVPNEEVILIFLLVLLFYLLTRRKVNFTKVLTVIALSFLTSKVAWFIETPFILFTLLFYQRNLSKRSKLIICISSLLITSLTVVFFLKIPQSFRSLLENNFPLFSDITIKNGIDRLRGQGVASGWHAAFEKLLFNKLHFLSVGFLNWLSNLQLSILFSQFDKTGQFGFVGMGALPKILIIPFLFSIVNLFKKGDKKIKFLLGYFAILTFPIFFIYPKPSPNIVAIILPFIAILIAYGLFNINKRIGLAIMAVMVLEVLVSLSYLTFDIKNTNNLRPDWIKNIILDGYGVSKNYTVVFSDDAVDDVVPFIEWYTKVMYTSDYSKIDFPYKFRQYKLADFKIIGHEDKFYNCGLDKPTVIFASSRDLNKVQKEFEINIDKIYQDSLGNNAVYKLQPKICIK